MSTRRWMVIGMCGVAMMAVLTVRVVGQQSGTMSSMSHDSMMKMTPAQKIVNATSAAPATISADATVLDWPATEGAAPQVLRAGKNGWTCLPDMPDTKGNDPMCVDAVWMNVLQAYLAHKAPEVKSVGIGYMLAPGGGWGSNSDPYAMKEASDNHWGLHGPHLMILVPDLKSLAGLPTEPSNGGPYVMWSGTPYAHVMAPVPGPEMTPSSKR